MPAYFIDALRHESPLGAYWRLAANTKDGAPATVTYAFMNRASEALLADPTYGNPAGSFQTLDSGERMLVERAMGLISSVANVRYVEVSRPSDAHVRIGSFDIAGNIAGYANSPVIDPGNLASLAIGEVMLDVYTGVDSLAVILHELGHTLGLKHPFEGSHNLPDAEDRHANTVMSYDWSTDPHNLMIFDVIALQSIYGPAKLRRGDNTYVLGQNKVIWDGGGHDRIDASAAAQGVTLSLDDGNWSQIGTKTASFLSKGQIYIGDFTFIEDAVGSRYSDRLSGNKGANDLKGGAGNDVLMGREGQDDLWGGAGEDRFVFGRATHSGLSAARDRIFGFTDGDRVDLSALDLVYRATRSFTGTGHEVRVDGSSSGALTLSADLDGDRRPGFEIVMRGTDHLDRNDLIL